ncbi:Hypothetical predicted protein [Lecanosticta acicola]|uniref:Metallo-beta-lactamase domain-containing protein n=1 Tax=Lecanosticta acicola TaxID=111012 RepID=A0AAI8Z8R1_9PEZI|nr:Hypothetical predicted protein [Lecanosticta acicola]
MVDPLPRLPPTTRLSPRVIRILGGNPSKFALQGTNTYLIGSGRERLLLDTGEGKRIWKEELKKVLEGEGCTLLPSKGKGKGKGKEGGGGGVLLTHWHADHVGGVQDVKEILLEGKNESESGEEEEEVKIYKNNPSPGQLEIQNGQTFSVQGATLRALHTPGHTTDHMAFFLEEEAAMFTGDNVLGHGTAVFEDLATYLRSLETMAATEGFEGRAYPGHGEVVENGRGRVREYLAHRKQREEEILGVLGGREAEAEGEQGGGKCRWSSMEIVKVVYQAYPENLHAPAEGGVRQVLKKLEGDGKVREDGESGKWSLVGGKAALL